MDAEPLTREACGGSDSDTPLVGDVCNALAAFAGIAASGDVHCTVYYV